MAHDMCMTSISLPMIGCGNLGLSTVQVMMAMLDACSLFRMKGSTLTRVTLVVNQQDQAIAEVCKIHMIRVLLQAVLQIVNIVLVKHF